MRAAGERRYPNSAGHVFGSATSKAAAESMEPRLSVMQDMVLILIREAGSHGATDAEIQVGANTSLMTNSLLRPRRCELLAMGKIKDSGTTRKGPSGKPMTVWVLA